MFRAFLLLQIIVFIFSSSTAFAGFWSRRNAEDYQYETSESYDFPSCKKFESDNDFSYDIFCEIQSSSEVDSRVRSLLESGQKVGVELHKEFLITDLKDFVLKSLEKKILKQLELRDCYVRLIGHNSDISDYCLNITNTMTNEARELYPRLRLHMALKKPLAYHVVGAEPTFEVDRNIFHTREKTRVEPVEDSEIPAIQEQFDEETKTYEQEWLTMHKEKACIDMGEDGLLKFRDEKCSSFPHKIMNDYINTARQTQTRDHEAIYRDILASNPHFAFLHKAKLPENKNLMNMTMANSLDDLVDQGMNEYQRLLKKDSGDTTFLLRYPEIIESYLSEKGADRVSCDGLQQLHNKYGEGGWYDLASDLGLGAAAILGGGACVLTEGIACAAIVAVGSEGIFLGKDQMNLEDGISLYKAGMISSSHIDKLERSRNFSLALAPLSLVGLSAGKGLATTFAKRHLTRQALKSTENWLHYVATSPLQNRSWIRVARNSSADFFFDVENSALKRLNDTMGDKNIVTAITNIHKHILFDEVDTLVQKFPGLKVEKYSDFKSSRFAFTFKDGKAPPGFQKELDALMKRVGTRYDQAVKKIEGINLNGESPQRWFSAGAGESADQAGLASRQARNSPRAAPPSVSHFKDVSKALEATKESIEGGRRSIALKFSQGPLEKLLSSSADGIKVPSLEVFEVMRKSKGKSSEELVEIFKKRFDVDVTAQDMDQLTKYTNEVDQFSPGLWLEERVVANLDEAELGGFSADFKGMGARNIQQVALDMAKPSKSLAETVDQLRKGEGLVTEGFDKAKSSYQELISRELKEMGIKVTNHCSGDDCVSLPVQTLTKAQEEKILSKIAKSGNPDGYRLSFIPPGIATRDRSNLALHGELIEKEIRSILTGFGKGKVAPEVMSSVAIAVRMPREIAKGGVEVILASGSEAGVSRELRAQINSALKEATAKVNSNLEKELGSEFHYESAY